MSKKSLSVAIVSILAIFFGFLIVEAAPTITGGVINGPLTFSGGDTDITTVSNQNFSIMPGTGYVGIGTTIPGYLLDVAGTVNASQFLVNGSPLSAGGGYWASTTGGIYYSAGDVGIGTTAPARPLHLVTPASGDNILFETTETTAGRIGFDLKTGYAANAGDYFRFIFRGDLADTILTTYDVSSATWREFIKFAYGIGTLTLGSSATTTILGSAGNIGIGSTNPGYKLDVAGDLRLTGNIIYGNGESRTYTRDDAGLQGNAGAKSGFFETSAPAPAANWYPGAASWQHLIDVRHSNTGNNYALQIAGNFFDQNLYFRKTAGVASTGWNKFVAENSLGNVGIGLTPTNTYMLEVAGTGSFGGLAYGITPGGTNTYALATVEYVNTKTFPTGVSGQTLRHNGTSWIADSNIFNNGTNVGIGTTVPNQKLEVSGIIRNSILSGTGNRCLYVTATGDISAKSTDCGSASGGDNLGNHIATQNIQLGNYWLSGDGGSEGVFVSSTGNVGIGLPNPRGRLDVVTSSSSEEVPCQTLNCATSASNFTNDYNQGYKFTVNSDGQVTKLWLNVHDTSSHTVRLYNSAGTVLASANITGVMDTWVSASITPVSVTAGNWYVVAVRASNYRSKAMTTPVTSGSLTINESRRGIATDAMPTIADTGQMFGLADITFIRNGNDAFILTSAGSVGIGTTVPGQRLDVVGALQTRTTVGSNNGSVIVGQDGSEGLVSIYDSFGTQGIRLDSVGNSYFVGGNVGVGTTVPGARLVVKDSGTGHVNIGQFSASSNYSGISFTTSPQAVTSANYSLLGEGINTFVGRPTGGVIYFRENNSDQMTLASGGNFGIGDTTPSYKLEVNGTGSFGGLAYGITPGGTNTYALTTVEYVNARVLPGGVSGQTLRYNGTGWVADSNLFNSGANIGVGTTAPTAKLQIGNGSSADIYEIISGMDSFSAPLKYAEGIFGTSAASNYAWAGAITNHPFVLRTNNVDRFIIDTAGKVGMGTTNPQGLLQVYSAASSTPGLVVRTNGYLGVGTTTPVSLITAVNTTPGYSATMFLQNNGGAGGATYAMQDVVSGGEWYFKATAAGDFKIRDNHYAMDVLVIEDNAAANSIYIKPGGNVGLGVTNPGYKLDVSGTGNFGGIAYGITPGSSSTYALTTVEYVNAHGVPTGTSGQTLRHNGTSWTANSVLYNNGTNVGVGTANPGGTLDVMTGDTSGLVLSNTNINHGMTALAPTNSYGKFSNISSGLTIMGLSNSDTTGFYLDAVIGATNPIDYTSAMVFRAGKANPVTWQALDSTETAFQFRNFTTNLMTILGSGNVGIGTTNPINKVHIGSYTGLSGADLLISNANGAVSISSNASENSIYGTGRVKIFAQGAGLPAMTLASSSVGIGTTAPTSKLQIVGSLAASGTFLAGGATTLSALGGISTSSIVMADNTGALFATTTAYLLSAIGALPSAVSGQTLRHNGANWVADSQLFNNGSNIGIGTTAPRGKFDVMMTSPDESPCQLVNCDSGATDLTGDMNVGYKFTVNADGQITKLWFNVFDTDDHTVRLYDSSGTVLASATRSGLYHLWASVDITPVNVTAGNWYVVAVRTNNTYRYKNMSMPSSDNITVNEGRSAASTNNMPTGSSAGTIYGMADITYRKNGTADSFIVSNTNNIGIGTTNPAYKLDVAGAINGTSVLINGSPIAGTQWLNSGNNIYYNAGNIAIGATPSAYKLDVSGSLKANTLLVNSTVTLSSLAGVGGTVMADLGGNLYLSSGSSGALPSGSAGQTLRHNGTTWATSSNIFNDDTNVGIGTVSPATKLHIYTGDGTSGLRTGLICSGATTSKLLTDASGTIICGSDQAGSGTGNIVDTLTSTLGAGNNAGGLNIVNVGNLGIGTAAPGVKLHVYTGDGTSGFRTGLVCSNSTSSKLLTDADGTLICGADQSGSGTGNIVDTLSSTLGAGNDASGAGMINLGNVGIGTASPATRLHLYDASSGPILTMSGNNSNYRGVTLKDTTGAEQWFYGNNSSNLFVIRQGGTTDALTVSSTGNVGFGTASPAAKLTIATGNGTSGLKTDLICSGATSSKLLTDASGNIVCGSDQAGSGTGNIIDNLSATLAAGNDGGGYNMLNLGNLGLGTASPSGKIHVVGTSYLDGNVFVGGGLSTYDTTVTDTYVEAGGYCMGNGTNCITSWPSAGFTGSGSTNYVAKFSSTSGLTYGIIYDTGTRVGIGTASPSSSYILDVNGEAEATAWQTSSDRRYKTNISSLSNVLSKLNNIEPIYFDWNQAKFPEKNFSTARQIGFIAQDVEEYFPELVITDSQGYKSLAYDRFSAVLLEAIKEQQAEINSLEARIDSLEKALQEK